MQTFSMQVQIGDGTKTFITGAEHQGEATSALATFLKADIKDINILKIAPKSKIIFVPPLSNGHREMSEGRQPDTNELGF